jgi:hypothetical protein
MNRRPSIWRTLKHKSVCKHHSPIHNYNQSLGVLDADIREERVMSLIEKKNLFIAKRAASFIAALLALIVLAGLVSAFSLSLDQSKDGKPDFTGIWKAESLTIESGEPPAPGREKEKIEIDHKNPELKMIKSIEGTDKRAELSYTIGAEERAMAFGADTMRSKAAWNGKQLIITSRFEIEQGPAELKEIWDLGDDQKTLIITGELLNDKWKMVFKRQ